MRKPSTMRTPLVSPLVPAVVIDVMIQFLCVLEVVFRGK
ncbi:putative membrane protein [Synechococcus sp. SYN20]|nr:putative membrane protein [Synechococcus sp. SYN20]